MKRYVLGISGASGAAIGIRVLKELLKSSEVHLAVSDNAFLIMREECGIDLGDGLDKADTEAKARELFGAERLFYWPSRDMSAPPSSGSFKTDGMFVAPCSMKTLAGIANGFTTTLIERASDVAIKEGRPLVLCPRETPLSAIHIENMLKLARLGVKIVPPMMGFYPKPKSVEDMADFAAGKALDAMGVENGLYKRWAE